MIKNNNNNDFVTNIIEYFNDTNKVSLIQSEQRDTKSQFLQVWL